MQYIKAALRFDFADPLQPWLDLRSILRVAEGNPAAELQGQPVVFTVQASHRRVALQVRVITIEQEWIAGQVEFFDGVIATVADFRDVTALPEIRTMRLDAVYIDPFDLAFHELANRLKAAFLSGHPMVAAATDVSVALDRTGTAGITDHVQLGPMVPEQLNGQFLAFPRDDLPQQFVFAGVGRSFAEPMPFSMDSVERIVRVFAEDASRAAQEAFEAIRSA